MQASERLPNNLSCGLSSFVGREQEMSEVERLLDGMLTFPATPAV
jgi:hypothetical protein